MAGLHKFIALALVCIVGIGFVSAANEIDPPICIHDYAEIWPNTDINKYWYCTHKGSTPLELRCPPGRGALRTADKSGCVPFIDWDCTSKAGPPSCYGANFEKPHRHVNPNMFWACDKDHKAVEAECLDWPIEDRDNPTYGTRGFVDNAKNLGCVPWNVWVCDKADDYHRE